MRINLNVPYAEKDAAKSLGAKWDMARRTWYLLDIEDLTPFMRWIPKMTDTFTPAPQRKAQNGRYRRATKHAKPFGTTISIKAYCGCDHVLPWEDCEHTKVT